jgi:hypothetical protein
MLFLMQSRSPRFLEGALVENVLFFVLCILFDKYRWIMQI